ncbi:helix-turn-helix protein [Rhodococcus sp. AG1013]|uniref:helix-turn-helix domain-containing protein n=1 Tax=Rhodococcus sp. AG1013 TaxID=2183996 RepID=UPI000E0CB5FE|nr:helix-turn-helix domain-containing protein [Rhodococcus sp. AG1013]RDI32399.1 helix-turn-helix protein [Rhodococcus sp. AG1013]
MSTIKTPLNVSEVATITRRHPNRVRNAANSGALKGLPRPSGGRHQFTEAAVQEWIDGGSPEMPPVRIRLASNKKAAS